MVPASRSLILLFIITLLPVHTSRTIELLSSLLTLVLVDLFLSILSVLVYFVFTMVKIMLLICILHINILDLFLSLLVCGTHKYVATTAFFPTAFLLLEKIRFWLGLFRSSCFLTRPHCVVPRLYDLPALAVWRVKFTLNFMPA